MKTPIQTLIDKLDKVLDTFPDEDLPLSARGLQDAYINCKQWANELLAEEKQQIVKAAKWMPKPYDNIEFIPELAQQYYKENYKQ